MEERYKIVCKGELKDGVSFDSVAQNFASLFKIPIEKASAILQKDSLILKKDLSLEQANIFQEKLLSLGMVTEKIGQGVAANSVAYTVPPVPVSPAVTGGNNLNQQYSTSVLNAEVDRPQSKVGVYRDIIGEYFHYFEFSVKNRLIVSFLFTLLFFIPFVVSSQLSFDLGEGVLFLIMLVSLYCITGLFKIENTKWRYISFASLAVLFGRRFYEEGLYLLADSFLLKGFVFLFLGLAVAALIFRFLAYLGSRLFS